MAIIKEIKGNELYLWVNGNLIYKRWLDKDVSKVFDKMAYDKYTLTSHSDLDQKESDNLAIVKARVHMYSTEEGGRKTPFSTGYRPNHVFEYQNDRFVNTFMGDIILDDGALFEPGQTKEVTVRFLLVLPIEKYLHKGRAWWIHEGHNKLGEAEILEVIKSE